MRKSTFKTEWNAMGIRTIFGKIEVLMNSQTISKKCHNPSTHDDEIKHFQAHTIKGTIDGQLYQEITDVMSDDELVNKCKILRADMNSVMMNRANSPDKKSFIEKMHEIGFTDTI